MKVLRSIKRSEGRIMKKVLSVSCIAVFAFLVVSCSSGVDSYRETRELTLPAEELDSIEITAGPGSLDITPVDNADEIILYAEVETGVSEESSAKERMKKELLLTLKRKGNRGVLESGFYGVFSFLGIHQGRAVHLDLRVPRGIEVIAVNEDGEVHLADLHNPVRLRNKGGNVFVDGLKGPLRIENKKGDLSLTSINGDITVLNEGGDLSVKDIQGEMKISDKGGNIKAVFVKGNITIEDTKGDIFVEELKGDLDISGAGKGDCVYINVVGNIQQNE